MEAAIDPAFFSSSVWDSYRGALTSIERGALASSEDLRALLQDVSPDCAYSRTRNGSPDYEPVLDTIQSQGGFDNIFARALPHAARIALKAHDLFSSDEYSLLPRGCVACLELPHENAACLLALMLFGLLPPACYERADGEDAEYSAPSLTGLTFPPHGCSFAPNEHKLRCILHYFNRAHAGTAGTSPMVVSRVSLADDRRAMQWQLSSVPLCSVKVMEAFSSITDTPNCIHTDFANARVGGGVAGMGCAQEEIVFCTHPELIVSKLFCGALDAGEALLISGPARVATSRGFNSTFEFCGDYVEAEEQRTVAHLVIDAKMYANEGMEAQVADADRDFFKALCGFDACSSQFDGVMVATGNWGCGAFGGHSFVKAMIQWAAASIAGVELVYFPWDDTTIQETLDALRSFAGKCTVKRLWAAVRLVSDAGNEDAAIATLVHALSR